MRVFVALHAEDGFGFDKNGKMLPAGRSSCNVEVDGDTTYAASTTSYADIRCCLEKLIARREFCAGGSAGRMSAGKEVSTVFAEFTLASRKHLVPLPNEEALVEWLMECLDILFLPDALVATVVWPSGAQEKLHFDVYEDSIERVLTGQQWSVAADGFDAVLTDLGVLAATWSLSTSDGQFATGAYRAPVDAEMEIV